VGRRAGGAYCRCLRSVFRSNIRTVLRGAQAGAFAVPLRR